MEKNKICFIRAKLKRDYVFDGIASSGYRILIPYKDHNLVLRICRELWKKLKLPKISIWYNRAVRQIEQEIIIVKDPIITEDFMRFLRRHNPQSYIIFDYDNRVGRSLDPERIRQYVDEIWSFDEEDCEKYGLRKKGNAYFEVYRTKPNPVRKYDVFYVGRDKGRMEQLRELEQKLKEQGLKTFFYICADRGYLTWKNKAYQPFLPYDEYLELLRDSRAILNIVPEGQQSITQREMEAVFDGVKCITNNKGIRKFALYDTSRYFILDHNFDAVRDFLDTPFKEVEEQELTKYYFERFIDSMLADVKERGKR